jgi:ubiquinone/menaquinone biosynthesis C-methylase UbiE
MSDAWERFLANIKSEGQSSTVAWSETYRLGDHSLWDHSSPSTELIAYILGARLAARTRVLDLGCGTGADAIFLAKQNYEVHGLDFSKEALRLAEQRARDCGVVVDWHECSALNTPFDDGYFDLITDRGCFHHIGGALRRQYAEEIARILRRGGVLFLRGNRKAETPFFPVDRDSLSENFDPQLFEIGPDIPFFCAVDTGGICATAVTIVRRDLNIVRGKRPISFLKWLTKPLSRGDEQTGPFKTS